MNIPSLLGILSILVILIVFGYLRYDRNRWRAYALRAESDAWTWYLSSCERDRQIAAMQEYLYTVSLNQQTPTPNIDGDKQYQLPIPLPIVAIRKDGGTEAGVESSNGKPKNGKDSAQSVESVIAEVESIAGKIDQRGKDKIAVWHSGKGKNSPAEYAKRIKAMGALVH